MKHYQQAKNLVCHWLILIILSMYSYHSFCDDTFFLNEFLAWLQTEKKNGDDSDNNIQIGVVLLDLTTENMSDQERMSFNPRAQPTSEGIVRLINLFFRYSSSGSSSTGEACSLNNIQWNQDHVRNFLQIITDIFRVNLREGCFSDYWSAGYFRGKMKEFATTFSINPSELVGQDGHSMSTGTSISMADYLNPSSEKVTDDYRRNNYNLWLMAITFLRPFIIYGECSTLDEAEAIINNDFNYMASVLSTALRQQHIDRAEQENASVMDVITNPFNSIRQLGDDGGLSFFVTSYMRALCIAISDILIAGLPGNLQRISTVENVFANYLSTRLHIDTIVSILVDPNELPPHSDCNYYSNISERLMKLLEQSGVNKFAAAEAVDRLLNSRSDNTMMRNIINKMLPATTSVGECSGEPLECRRILCLNQCCPYLDLMEEETPEDKDKEETEEYLYSVIREHEAYIDNINNQLEQLRAENKALKSECNQLKKEKNKCQQIINQVSQDSYKISDQTETEQLRGSINQLNKILNNESENDQETVQRRTTAQHGVQSADFPMYSSIFLGTRSRQSQAIAAQQQSHSEPTPGDEQEVIISIEQDNTPVITSFYCEHNNEEHIIRVVPNLPGSVVLCPICQKRL